MGRKIVFISFFYLLLVSLSVISCAPKISAGLESDLKELEKQDICSSDQTQERTEELKRFIEKEQKEALKVINASSNRSRFLRMLGLQYLALDMYGEAYTAFSEARLIAPTNALLAYYQALAAANVEKSMPKGSQEKIRFCSLAEDAYAIALRLKPDFKEALYGSAIFYAYELGQLDKALSFINRLVAISPKDERAWLVKAQIHTALGEKEAAAFAYQEALNYSSSREKEDLRSLMQNNISCSKP